MENTNLTQQNTLTQIETYYDEEKTTLMEMYYVDKNWKREGPYESFHDNNQPEVKCTYKNDQLITQF